MHAIGQALLFLDDVFVLTTGQALLGVQVTNCHRAAAAGPAESRLPTTPCASHGRRYVASVEVYLVTKM